ncbi:MAG: DUF6262 family protein [Actinomycetota bacterium]|nr:DUF6262 family protein [Actinomycetota bacterium]
MRADNTEHIIAAAKKRSRATTSRAIAALRKIDNSGGAVNFDAVAREAGISRSWLYNQPELRSEIERLRSRQRPTPSRIPDRQRATDASLHQRLQIASDRIRQLESDNTRLRQALAEALGDRRTNPHPDTPDQQLSTAPRAR